MKKIDNFMFLLMILVLVLTTVLTVNWIFPDLIPFKNGVRDILLWGAFVLVIIFSIGIYIYTDKIGREMRDHREHLDVLMSEGEINMPKDVNENILDDEKVILIIRRSGYEDLPRITLIKDEGRNFKYDRKLKRYVHK